MRPICTSRECRRDAYTKGLCRPHYEARARKAANIAAGRPAVALALWSDAEVERLRVLWAAGMSCGQVAKVLAKEFPHRTYTRNGVIGKVHRMGFSAGARTEPHDPARRGPIPPPRPRAPKPPPRQVWPKIAMAPAASTPMPPRPPAPPQPAPAPEIPTATLLALTARMCRWPIGDPRDSAFGFCGCPKADTGPYCEAHAARASVPYRTKNPTKALFRSVRRAA